MNIPPQLLSDLIIELNLTTSVDEQPSTWNYLFRWQDMLPFESSSTSSVSQLSVRAEQPNPKPKSIQQHLNSNILVKKSSQNYQNLELIYPSNNTVNHFQYDSAMFITGVFENEVFPIISLRYLQNQLTIPFTVPNLQDSTGIIPGLSFLSFTSTLTNRFSISVRCFISKSAFHAQLIKSKNFLDLVSPPLKVIYKPVIQSLVRIRNSSIREHPYLKYKLKTQLVMQNRLLVNKNLFLVGGNVKLSVIQNVQRGILYFFDFKVFKNINYVNNNQQYEQVFQGVSQVQKTKQWRQSNKNLIFNQLLCDLTSLDLYSEKFDFISSQVKIVIKLYSVYNKFQVQSVGFQEIFLPVQPVPKYNRFQAQKTHYGYSGFGNSNESDSFGLELHNSNIQFEVVFNIFHHIKSQDKQVQNKILQLESGVEQLEKLKNLVNNLDKKEPSEGSGQLIGIEPASFETSNTLVAQPKKKLKLPPIKKKPIQ